MRTRPIALVLAGLLAAACGDDPASTSDSAQPPEADTTAPDDVAEPDAEPDTTPELSDTAEPEIAAPDPGSFRWDLGAVAPDDFYAYPWPSDLRLNALGAPDLTAFSTERAKTSILESVIAFVERGQPGFSPLSSAYFGLSVALDPETLEDNVLLVDLDRAERLPRTVEFNAAGGGYWPAMTLAIHPDYQVPPRAGARLAVLLLDGLRTADGQPLTPPDAIARLEDRTDPEATHLQSLLPTLPALGLERQRLVAATVWRAADPMAELRALAAHFANAPPPPITGLTLVERKPNYDHYRGAITITEAFSGEPPYSGPFGAGLIEVDADGAPKTPRTLTIPFTLTTPRTPPPPTGFPLVLYGHGLGETHEGFLRTAAAPLGSRGVAVIGLDPPLQGTRNQSGLDDRTLIVNLSVGNIVGGREVLRQGVLDYLQLARAVADPAFLIPAELAPDGAAVAFDPTRLGFFGHSEGAQIGALLLPLTPALGPAVMSAGGGGAAITMLALKLDELDVSATVAEFLGVDLERERWALGHPIVTAVIQPLLDAADPLHLARHLIHEPLPDNRPHDLVMLEGLLDQLTPPASTEALASAIGLPIAEPVAREISGLTQQGIAPVTLPASANLTEVNGYSPTGALLQFADKDHYIIYFDAAVRARLMDFLTSALTGTPVIPD